MHSEVINGYHVSGNHKEADGRKYQGREYHISNAAGVVHRVCPSKAEAVVIANAMPAGDVVEESEPVAEPVADSAPPDDERSVDDVHDSVEAHAEDSPGDDPEDGDVLDSAHPE